MLKPIENAEKLYNSFINKQSEKDFFIGFSDYFSYLDKHQELLACFVPELEKGNEDERCLSFMMRNELLHVLSYCLYLVGGYSWLKEKDVEFRKLCAKTMKLKLIEFMGEAKNA